MKDLSPEAQKALESLHQIYVATGNVGQIMDFENVYSKDEAAILKTIRTTVANVEAELAEIKRLLPELFDK